LFFVPGLRAEPPHHCCITAVYSKKQGRNTKETGWKRGSSAGEGWCRRDILMLRACAHEMRGRDGAFSALFVFGKNKKEGCFCTLLPALCNFVQKNV
jgi:hypothetical protein